MTEELFRFMEETYHLEKKKKQKAKRNKKQNKKQKEIKSKSALNFSFRPICPISMQHCTTPVMTLLGGVYDKDNIVEWFSIQKKNGKFYSEPLTNEILPSNQLINLTSWDLRTKESLKYRRDDMRKSTLLWRPDLMFQHQSSQMLREIKQKTIYLLKQKETVETKENWQFYQKKCLNLLTEFDPALNGVDGVAITMESFDRPKKTGKDFELIDLTNQFIQDLCLKGMSFNGAILDNTTFVSCNLSRCTFVGASLQKTQFYNCDFIGEEVNFTGATGNIIVFKKCNIEPIGKWESVSSLSPSFSLILKQRGFESIGVVIK